MRGGYIDHLQHSLVVGHHLDQTLTRLEGDFLGYLAILPFDSHHFWPNRCQHGAWVELLPHSRRCVIHIHWLRCGGSWKGIGNFWPKNRAGWGGSHKSSGFYGRSMSPFHEVCFREIFCFSRMWFGSQRSKWPWVGNKTTGVSVIRSALYRSKGGILFFKIHHRTGARRRIRRRRLRGQFRSWWPSLCSHVSRLPGGKG